MVGTIAKKNHCDGFFRSVNHTRSGQDWTFLISFCEHSSIDGVILIVAENLHHLRCSLLPILGMIRGAMYTFHANKRTYLVESSAFLNNISRLESTVSRLESTISRLESTISRLESTSTKRKKTKNLKRYENSGQITIFHQPGFSRNKRFPLLNHHLG